ncbi:uncharacterized protein LOC121394223 isoform X1 [Xenopus laevis]|uniref:Uncharacterized protein LOC121394223 isoform X1 n=1 Tax=Xenopus laevis TaxID=8355 RepID=A0A8J1KT56_XENLA|nr:uncharacterized protein LOC121394223 isoform X1 [Xenopus laevis]
MLDEAVTQGWITEDLRNFLYVKDPVRPVLYTLPKVHKNLLHPPGRPIISARGSLTEQVAKYVDSLLQPLIRVTSTYLQDTNDFLKIVNSIDPTWCDNGFFFVTMDVNSLYTIIPHEEGLSVVRELMVNAEKYNGPPTEFILSLLHFILYRNYFKFEKDYYLQTAGTAMGSNVAPTYANAFMHTYEMQHILSNPTFRKFGGYYRRYIDDLFFLWFGSEKDLLKFFGELNSHNSTVRFTLHYNFEKIDFLDVTIYKQCGQLHTKIFRKPTDRNTLLHFNSSHPKHLLKSLPKSQMLRAVRITSEEQERQQAIQDMASDFLARGYPAALIEEIKSWALALDRASVLKDTGDSRRAGDCEKNKLFYMTTYGPHTSLIKQSVLQNWPIVATDPDLGKLVSDGFSFGYKRSRNLKELFTQTDPINKYICHSKVLAGRSGVYRCGNCSMCSTLITGNQFFHPHTGKSYKIKDRLTCTSKNVIYIIKCPCGLVYCGKTCRQLKERISMHRSSIRAALDPKPKGDSKNRIYPSSR